MFSPSEIEEIKSRGSNPDQVIEQIKNFEKGFPFLKIIKAATIGDGIVKLDDKEKNRLQKRFEEGIKKNKVVKFVPASGAASRMFKDLYSFYQKYSENPDVVNISDHKSVSIFYDRIKDFAFYNDLKQELQQKGINIEKAINEKKYGVVLEYFLTEAGLGYGELPKGLLKFHKYEDEDRTPVQEHLVEGTAYTKDADNNVFLHLTVSPEHKEKFIEHVQGVKNPYEKKYNVQFDLSYSEQKASTDTIAVDLNNKPFKNEDGSILFRPAGHGALIENLNELEADIVFIKNIDNVVPDKIKETTFIYKKVLGGLLLHYQTKIFDYIKELNANTPSIEKLQEIQNFLEYTLSIKKDNGIHEDSVQQKEYLLKKLNRPIRVCGMVKNEGEAGGGPFWARNSDGTISLQIVESSQVDQKDPGQNQIFKNSTHFNPVDLVCSLKNHEGEKFDLLKFRDPATGFITEKSKDGKELKAQELPGLWNGAMADWNTLFLEVPIITFNPVKTVNDLLRKEHQ